MKTVVFQPGEAVFRAGDPSRAVYVVDQGEIVILSGEGDEAIEVARLHEGDLFGESGVLEDRVRSASAVAVTRTALLETDAETFFKAFHIDNEGALTLLKLLCQRLRSTTQQAARSKVRLDHKPAETEPAKRAATLRLVPDSEFLADLVGAAPTEIRRLPFQVGNRYGGEVSAISTERNLCLPAAADGEFSAPHFEVLRRGEDFVVRDLSRRSGTIVNGELISRHFQESIAKLKPGANQIVAGRTGSPFRFKLLLGTG